MDIARVFAAAVFAAERAAAKACKHGRQTTASDMVTAALIDLWGRGAADGLTSKAIQAIADKYVRVDGRPASRGQSRSNATMWWRYTANRCRSDAMLSAGWFSYVRE